MNKENIRKLKFHPLRKTASTVMIIHGVVQKW